MINAKIIGEKLKIHRKARGFTRKDLADMLARHESTIYKMEQGNINIYAEDLFYIADVLNVNIYDFGRWQ